ncbi:IS6 family transposase [Pelagibius litoralis]|uniref:IS6 family transposase n=1 Tax=Pelagibius litoralis TaxID=374515 RepID=A0A967F2Q5_9PROT|nr:IS6 family transposase [Pelagibius litoralis]NIA72108.1 IS6 family transposase [Pelagibius litoralis]
MDAISYRNHHYPASIVQRSVWLYARFNLSLRDVEELMAERGMVVSYETVRRWVARFGPQIAKRLRGTRPRVHPQWHLDEVYVSIGGRWVYLWRAIDHEGEVLDVLVQSKRDKKTALKLMRKLLKKTGLMPKTIVTDKWRAYAAAFRDLGLTAWHHQAKWKNNRIEGSHVRIRRRERSMQRFRSPGSAQRFLSTHAAVYNTFAARRHLVSAAEHRYRWDQAFTAWRLAAGPTT